jgi:predicted RNA-binding Zn-ribbon protein involved in translation (DUF1610 family)
MAKVRDQKSIGITGAEFKVLAHSKKTFETLTNCQISWGAYLIALSSGALATYAIHGLELSCPNCGKRAIIRYVHSKAEPGEDSLGPSPSSSTELPGQGKR